MRETIEAVRGVADNSSGIAGWHLNGEIAKWSEILPEIDDIETPATDSIVAEAEARGLEKAKEIVRHCHDNICPDGLAENRQYEEAMVQPYLDGISDELDFEIEQLREGADK